MSSDIHFLQAESSPDATYLAIYPYSWLTRMPDTDATLRCATQDTELKVIVRQPHIL